MGTDGLAASSDNLDVVLGRYRALLGEALHAAIHTTRDATPTAAATQAMLDGFYGQIEYHHGWRTPDLQSRPWQPGKLLRPTLLLLASELAAGHTGGDEHEAVHKSIPAAVAVELVHNFSLVHDDIEDGDEERHHQPTLWKLWGVPLAINTGDGIFALAHLQLSHLPARGVSAESAIQLAGRLDATCVELCEGQYLDMSFEGRRDVTVAMYLDMIGRKTAALMECAAAMGSLIGAPQDTALSAQLGSFGRALGVGFQLRDDMLGIWSATALGKTEAGDLRHKKMSLPVIAALEYATPKDQDTLTSIYGEMGPATESQIAAMLAILERTQARERTRAMLRDYCDQARNRLAAACATTTATESCAALGTLLDFVAAEGI